MHHLSPLILRKIDCVDHGRQFLPGCVASCKAHSTLEEALAACSKQHGCGGVTQSADQGQRGYQLRASTSPQHQPAAAATGESQESSWVKMECAGGEGPPLSSARLRPLTFTRLAGRWGRP